MVSGKTKLSMVKAFSNGRLEQFTPEDLSKIKGMVKEGLSTLMDLCTMGIGSKTREPGEERFAG